MILFRNGFYRMWMDIKTKKTGGVFAIVLASLFFWLYGLEMGSLWFLFLVFLVYDWDSYVIGALALIVLAFCLLLSLFNQVLLVEVMTVYAFLFLVMSVTLQIIEYWRHPNKNE